MNHAAGPGMWWHTCRVYWEQNFECPYGEFDEEDEEEEEVPVAKRAFDWVSVFSAILPLVFDMARRLEEGKRIAAIDPIGNEVPAIIEKEWFEQYPPIDIPVPQEVPGKIAAQQLFMPRSYAPGEVSKVVRVAVAKEKEKEGTLTRAVAEQLSKTMNVERRKAEWTAPALEVISSVASISSTSIRPSVGKNVSSGRADRSWSAGRQIGPVEVAVAALAEAAVAKALSNLRSSSSSGKGGRGASAPTKSPVKLVRSQAPGEGVRGKIAAISRVATATGRAGAGIRGVRASGGGGIGFHQKAVLSPANLKSGFGMQF